MAHVVAYQLDHLQPPQQGVTGGMLLIHCPLPPVYINGKGFGRLGSYIRVTSGIYNAQEPFLRVHPLRAVFRGLSLSHRTATRTYSHRRCQSSTLLINSV